MGKNVVLKSREQYYIVFIFNYFQLTLFLVLIGKFDRKANIQPDLPVPSLIRAE